MEIVLVDVTIRREWMDLKVGDVIKMKKSHPCGTNAWELRRVGMDIRIRCTGCGHQIMLPRKQVEKAVRGFVSRSGQYAEKKLWQGL